MTEGYKDFIVHLDMYFLPDQLPFKFRNWGWEGTVLQNGVAVYILCVLERKGNLCYLQHMSQGASGTYDHREKPQRSNHLLETSPHESDLPWDVPGLEKNSSPAGCAHYQD